MILVIVELQYNKNNARRPYYLWDKKYKHTPIYTSQNSTSFVKMNVVYDSVVPFSLSQYSAILEFVYNVDYMISGFDGFDGLWSNGVNGQSSSHKYSTYSIVRR